MSYKDANKQREYQREWLLKRRLKWFSENGPCVNCVSWNKLEVHHLDSSKKIDHRVWSWSESRRCKELSKCIALCNGCHTEETRKSLQTKEHGSRGMYRRCKCSVCRNGNKVRMRKFRERKRLTLLRESVFERGSLVWSKTSVS